MASQPSLLGAHHLHSRGQICRPQPGRAGPRSGMARVMTAGFSQGLAPPLPRQHLAVCCHLFLRLLLPTARRHPALPVCTQIRQSFWVEPQT